MAGTGVADDVGVGAFKTEERFNFVFCSGSVVFCFLAFLHSPPDTGGE